MRRNWRNDAACRDINIDPELFFPTSETGPALKKIEDAKIICRRCPVAEDCLRWALETGEDAGIWGGMTEVERRMLKRRTSTHNTVPDPVVQAPLAPGATTRVF
jgi:WhiB family redox-sensing transcriptional regulator